MGKLFMKWISIFLFLGLSAFACSSNEQDPTGDEDPDKGEVFDIKISTLHVRDPFILADSKTQSYYLAVNDNRSFKVYKSKDLTNWRDEGKSFIPQSDFWGKQDFWAPDLYAYKGKYYLLATFSSTTKKRGTSILVSDNPKGPFIPLVNKAVTPENQMCLDGSLYIDKQQKPWLIYCHEWLEAIDGEVIAQRLSDDLIQPVGTAVVLFKASDAAWVGSITGSGVTGYVTDAPFIHQLSNGELIMLWSSFSKSGKYSIGLARSKSGNITGPWEHNVEPVNNNDGGHAMLFIDFKGRLMISYHSPNSQTERARIQEVFINNGDLVISK